MNKQEKIQKRTNRGLKLLLRCKKKQILQQISPITNEKYESLDQYIEELKGVGLKEANLFKAKLKNEERRKKKFK